MDYFVTDYNVKQPRAVALEDSIMQKGQLTAAGSKILENFVSPFDATVVARIQKNKIAVAGKTKMDEFGIVNIYADKPEETAGAIKAVADNAVSFSLCNDLFGKYRRQAAENNICYIHPTYGTVSRFGLIPLAPSMDQIGVACGGLTEGFQFLKLISGHDPNDGAMFPDEKYEYQRTENEIRIGVPADVMALTEESDQKGVNEFLKKFHTVPIKLEYFNVFKQVMYILSSAEISSSITRYDGIKFGYRAPNYKSVHDLYINTRTEALGLNAKLVSVIGAMVLSQGYYFPYYDKAMRVRNLIKKSARFDAYDVILLPTAIKGNAYNNLSLFSLAPLAGFPSVSFQFQGAGIQLIAGKLNENMLLTAWEAAQS